PCRPRPPEPWVGRAEQRNRRTPARGRKVRDRRIGADVDRRLRKTACELRPAQAAVAAFHRRIPPDLVEIGAFTCAWAARCQDAQPARGEHGGNLPPALAGPLLVMEHGRRMDDRERWTNGTLGRSGGRANHFGNSRDSKSVDEAQNIFDAMNAGAREYASIKEASAQNAAQSGVDWTDATMSRYPREQGWPIAGLS